MDDDPRDTEIRRLRAELTDALDLIARAHIHMVIRGEWDWVPRADAMLKLARARTGLPVSRPLSTPTSE